MRHWFVNIITVVVIAIVAAAPSQVRAEDSIPMDDDEMEAVLSGTLEDDTLVAGEMAELNESKAAMEQVRQEGMYKALKRKFIEGNAGFMSLVALALILGLAFCVERIIYLTLSEVNAKKLLDDVDAKIEEGDIEGAKDICRDTRGPVASICYQGLLRADDSVDSIERSITSYGQVQVSNLEKGCSWITLFIAIAPSLGFLGTVIGMVMAFDEIQEAGDISPTVVASGMKVALITTIFGIIVALILQVFYNYILNKIEQLTTQMEDAAITLLDILVKYKNKVQ
ncbi:MAG: MotA/TolQ/ExbB proton channel family protein [Prevotella sp.]|nr:MotA/TolQ/ExbB proton channel family protein [Prevotella sp.]